MQPGLESLTIVSAAILLFLVMDPFGNIPFFVAALQKVRPARRRLVVARELAIALVVLVVFLFLGQPLLAVLHVSEAALAVAGGIVLFLIALKMIFPSPGGSHEEVEGEPFIVPLAIPYVAGPSAMATLLLIMNREPERWREWLAAVGLAWAAAAAIIALSPPLSKVLGRRGLIAMERLMGMLLVVIAIQMLMNGMSTFVADPAG
jgi:MarC family membrane protein